MTATATIEKYPPWKNALAIIIERVEKEGFGIVVTHADLDNMLHIKKPKNIAEYQKSQFQRLTQIDALTAELLEQHHLCLSNVRAEGYQIMHPNDQVSVGSDRHIRKARREIRRALATIRHVRIGELDTEHEETRLQKMRLFDFHRRALNKRKPPAPAKPKQIKPPE